MSSLAFGLRWAQKTKPCFVTLRTFFRSIAGQGFQNTTEITGSLSPRSTLALLWSLAASRVHPQLDGCTLHVYHTARLPFLNLYFQQFYIQAMSDHNDTQGT